MNESDAFNKRVEALQRLLEDNYRNLDKIKDILSTMGKEIKRDMYKNVEGIIGTYDGYHLVDSKGNKYDIPGNYAAKSRLVYGDSIKMVEDNGTTVFKQIQKVERKKTEGVVSKKEGKWVVLTDSGSYKISDIAADFNQIQLNDEVIVFLPADNLNAPFATLDRLVNLRPQETHNSVPNQSIHKPVSSPPLADKKPSPSPVAPVRPIQPKGPVSNKLKPVGDKPKPQIPQVQRAPTSVKVIEPAPIILAQTDTVTDLPLSNNVKDIKPETEDDDLM